MREILFRGKDKDGKWHYAMSLSRHVTENGIITSYYIGAGNATVSAETVGQFTGLTDKNGKKIFEGDILKAMTVDTNAEQFAVVGFGSFVDDNNGDEYLGFYIEFDGIKTTASQLSEESVKCHFEVIGNIHDNPELLKEGADDD